MEAVKNGANRQEMHEVLRNTAMQAWGEVQEGKVNPMGTLLVENMEIRKYISKEKVSGLLNVRIHIGNAPERALILVKNIKSLIFF